MQNHPAMYHTLYRIPHNVALVRADGQMDGRTDGVDPLLRPAFAKATKVKTHRKQNLRMN